MGWKEDLKKQLINQEDEKSIIGNPPTMSIGSEMRFDSNLLAGCYYDSEDFKVYYFSGSEWIEVANCSMLEES